MWKTSLPISGRTPEYGLQGSSATIRGPGSLSGWKRRRAGIAERPNTFFMGGTGGGIWKTEDAGTYWMPVGEGQFNYASIGAIALHEKNPDIMYVGLGEPQLRQSVSWGDGMYKTVDGGETWEHIGLETSLHIARIRIHPDDPDRADDLRRDHLLFTSADRADQRGDQQQDSAAGRTAGARLHVDSAINHCDQISGSLSGSQPPPRAV